MLGRIVSILLYGQQLRVEWKLVIIVQKQLYRTQGFHGDLTKDQVKTKPSSNRDVDDKKDNARLIHVISDQPKLNTHEEASSSLGRSTASRSPFKSFIRCIKAGRVAVREMEASSSPGPPVWTDDSSQ